MDQTSSPSPARPASEWVYTCDRCGASMEERQCKIACPNCGMVRDCSDP